MYRQEKSIWSIIHQMGGAMPNSIFQTMSFKDVPNTFVSRSRYEREKAARETAEKLLEKKSYELYSANKKLKEMAMHFEAIAEEKTK